MTVSEPYTTAISWSVAFTLGVLVGRYSETHKETVMSLRANARARYDSWAPVLFIVIATLACAGIWLGASASWQNSKDLVTNCRNSNESRQAARSLWGYIVDLSEARNPDPTKREQRTIGDFRDYVNAVYVAHDCDDLSEKYPLPDPPEIIAPQPRDER